MEASRALVAGWLVVLAATATDLHSAALAAVAERQRVLEAAALAALAAFPAAAAAVAALVVLAAPARVVVVREDMWR